MKSICSYLISRWIWFSALILFLPALLYILLGQVLMITTADVKGLCADNRKAGAERPVGLFAHKTIEFHTRNPCFDSGVHLEVGERYKISVEAVGVWKDASIPAEPAGFKNWTDNFRFVMLAALPLRRHLTDGWFVVMGKIGQHGDAFPIRHGRRLEAFASGPLYLYVNDAIPPFCSSDCSSFYTMNNEGRARVIVEKLSL